MRSPSCVSTNLPSSNCGCSMRQKVKHVWLCLAQLSAARCVVALLSLTSLIRSANAVVVLPKGSNQPVMGYLMREDERTIVVRQPLPGGKSRESSFPKKELDELIITVSPQRLTELDPKQPGLYYEYAEELAEKQRDPEARDMAIRLYAI